MILTPSGTYNLPWFYVQTDPSWVPGSEFWYTNRPVGKNTLANYLQSIIADAKIPENFSNHSLYKTCATRLFCKGVDPQLIKEQQQ